jgi:glycosyltransferase involved in cell wall biosynthesis
VEQLKFDIRATISADNSDRWLAEAFDFILSQAYPTFEVVIFDGVSADSTANVATRYEAHTRYLHQVNCVH